MEQLKRHLSYLRYRPVVHNLDGNRLVYDSRYRGRNRWPFSLWAWVLLFIAICPIALTFAQLGKRYPNAGGTAFLCVKLLTRDWKAAWLGYLSV